MLQLDQEYDLLVAISQAVDAKQRDLSILTDQELQTILIYHNKRAQGEKLSEHEDTIIREITLKIEGHQGY